MEEGVEYWTTHIQVDSNTLPHWVRLYEKIATVLPQDRDVAIADLGCQGGYFAKFIRRKGYKNYWGVDFAPATIEMARIAVPEFKFTVGNVYDEKIQSKFPGYEVFVGIEFFQLLRNDLAVVEAIPKGKSIIMSFPNTVGTGSARSFRSARKVHERYALLVDFTGFTRVPRYGSACFWLAYGKRK